MGIRPGMWLLVGAVDLSKERRSLPVSLDLWEDRIPDELLWQKPLEEADYDKLMRKWNTPGFQFACLGDIIYNPGGKDDYRIPGLVGLVLNYIYDSDIFRAMAAVDKKYMQYGYSIVPNETLSEWAIKRIGYTEDDIRCHRAVNTVLESQPSLSRISWMRAVHYLRLCGWDLSEEDLHYIYAWDWS